MLQTSFYARSNNPANRININSLLLGAFFAQSRCVDSNNMKKDICEWIGQAIRMRLQNHWNCTMIGETFYSLRTNRIHIYIERKRDNWSFGAYMPLLASLDLIKLLKGICIAERSQKLVLHAIRNAYHIKFWNAILFLRYAKANEIIKAQLI